MVRCAWVEAHGSVSFSSTWMHFPRVRPWLFCGYDPLTQTQLREGRHHGLLVAKGLLGAAPAHSCESEAPAARHVDSGLLPSRSLAAPHPRPAAPSGTWEGVKQFPPGAPHMGKRRCWGSCDEGGALVVLFQTQGTQRGGKASSKPLTPASVLSAVRWR